MNKRIKYFQALVHCGNFTKAAEECGISQAAMSQHIKVLEHELKVQLLERDTVGQRKWKLTAAGEFFYQKSLVLTHDFERICADTAKVATSASKQADITIGVLQSYSGKELTAALQAFVAAHSDVTIQLFAGSHDELYYRLRAGTVDVILNDQHRAFSSEYNNVILGIKPLGVELSVSNPLACLESVTDTELKAAKCLAPAPVFASLNPPVITAQASLTTSAELDTGDGAVEDSSHTPAVASAQQLWAAEHIYYREILGIKSEIQWVGSLELARLQAAAGLGYVLTAAGEQDCAAHLQRQLRFIPLLRSGTFEPITRTYCAFYREATYRPYSAIFAQCLLEQFTANFAL